MSVQKHMHMTFCMASIHGVTTQQLHMSMQLHMCDVFATAYAYDILHGLNTWCIHAASYVICISVMS